MAKVMQIRAAVKKAYWDSAIDHRTPRYVIITSDGTISIQKRRFPVVGLIFKVRPDGTSCGHHQTWAAHKAREAGL